MWARWGIFCLHPTVELRHLDVPTQSQRKLRSKIVAAVLVGDTSALASELVLERVPYIFKNDWSSCRDWKRQLAEKIDIDPCDIFITGSAATGISLSPYKNFSFFDDKSDVDVAIISPHHFDTAWRHLRTLRRSALKRAEWDAIILHKENYIYWGCIATDRVLHLLPFGPTWLAALAYMEGTLPVGGRSVSARIYRDARSLRDYTAATLRSLKANLAVAA